MHSVQILQIIVNDAEWVLLASALFFLIRQKLLKRYLPFAAFLSFHLLSTVALDLMIVAQRIVPYHTYFAAYWISAAIGAGLTLWCVQHMFAIALAPLRGLQEQSLSAFGCICTLSVVIAAAMTVSANETGGQLLPRVVGHLVRFESVLVLCLLVFLTFTAHMLGLSFKSRIFNISLGFGILASTGLVTSAVVARNGSNGALDIFLALMTVVPAVIWTLAMALPEPVRRIVMIPVNSWTIRWNNIAKSMGHEPAAVAVGEDPLAMMHPNELLAYRIMMAQKQTADETGADRRPQAGPMKIRKSTSGAFAGYPEN